MKAAVLLAVAAALAAGCAPATRVVLLPQEGGGTGAVEVAAGPGKAVLSRPYESAGVYNRSLDVEQLDPEAVRQRYAQLLSVQPRPPERFTLYFLPGTSSLTPESSAELADVLSRATQRPGGEIVVTGHTDRVGTLESNDALSLQRAQAVRALIVGQGFNPLRVYAAGRGEREPVAPTADEVDEPRNRRVEILVR
ncbi:MAG: OmpA family protein [Ottowia sp.]|uniref:OmpA family protein n=1 Tax=Ottowia sp. TaxID=1898956 RepID=UPI0039E5B315